MRATYVEASLFKEGPGSVLGITFEPASAGDVVVVAALEAGFLAAESGALRLGDVIHEINGQAVSSASQAGMMLQAATGSVRITLTRENATPRNGWRNVTPWTAGRAASKRCAVNPAMRPAVPVGGVISSIV